MQQSQRKRRREKAVESRDRKEEAEAKEVETKGRRRNRLPGLYITARLAVEETLGTGTAPRAPLFKGDPCTPIRTFFFFKDVEVN